MATRQPSKILSATEVKAVKAEGVAKLKEAKLAAKAATAAVNTAVKEQNIAIKEIDKTRAALIKTHTVSVTMLGKLKDAADKIVAKLEPVSVVVAA